MVIEFQDEYRWLSNFYPCVIEHEGVVYPSVEHFYVAMKTLDETQRQKIRTTESAGQVKRLGRNLVLRDDWEQVKVEVMRLALTKKFSCANPLLKQKLIATGDVHLQEGNRWGDTFWGVCLKTNKGANNLGKLLMEVRASLTRGGGL